MRFCQRISNSISLVIDFFNSDTTEETGENNDEYDAPMELVASPSETEFLETRQCESEKNVFFLKTSKTGSQTLMAIMQRFGIQNNLLRFY